MTDVDTASLYIGYAQVSDNIPYTSYYRLLLVTETCSIIKVAMNCNDRWNCRNTCRRHHIYTQTLCELQQLMHLAYGGERNQLSLDIRRRMDAHANDSFQFATQIEIDLRRHEERERTKLPIDVENRETVLVRWTKIGLTAI